MYRNCYYDRKQSKIHEFTWDDDGNRISVVSNFTPFIFTETPMESKFKSVYGTNLQLKTFDKFYSKKNFIDRHDGRVFYDISPEQQYLIKKYRKVDEREFTKNDIRVYYLDIECPSPDEFPAPEKAEYEIDVLSVYDSLDDKILMWGKHPYSRDNVVEQINQLGGKIMKITKDQVVYHHIEDEVERLSHFLDHWENNCPDIYTHWNGDGFDTPYLINRMKILLPKNEYLRMSPVRNIRDVSGFDNYGNPQFGYKISGISDMDYMKLFRVFTQNKERESWALDSVAQDVLDCGKVEYESSNLYQLSVDDWETYCAYNLVDVLLLRSIEQQRRYLKLSRQTSYYGFGNPSDAIGKVRNIAGYATLMGLKNGVMVHTDFKKEFSNIEGGFVKEPVPNIHGNVETFDIKSLYPSIMMYYNMSTETKVGRVAKEGEYYRMFYREGGSRVFKSKLDLDEWLKENKYCISFYNIVFDQKKKGILTKIVEEQFSNKEKYGRLKKEAIANGDYVLAEEYEDLRAITKVFVNSIYGILATPSSPFYDPEIANSITITGQNIIKYSAEIIEKICSEKFHTKKSVVVAGDTDSVMCDLTEVFDFLGVSMFTEDDKLSESGYKLSDFFSKLLNDGVNKMTREERFCLEPNFIFEREKACASAIFFAKKQYAYYVLNNEGYDLEEGSRMKYTGLKSIKSEYSPFVKGLMDEIYFNTLSKYYVLGDAGAKKFLSSKAKECKERFYEGSFFDVSKRQKANNIKGREEEYVNEFEAGSGCPAHVSATINCNRVIKDLGLQNKYPEQLSGSKVMWVYLKQNIYQIDKISGVGGVLPEEFGMEIDYDKQFEKMLFPVIKQVFDVLNWDLPSFNFEYEFDIDDFFSE